VSKKRSSRIKKTASNIEAGKRVKPKEVKQFAKDLVDDVLAQPPGGAFKKLSTLFGSILPRLLPTEDPKAREARIQREEQQARREVEREAERHRKARAARGLGPKAGTGEPEPHIIFDEIPRGEIKLPKNPTYGDYLKAKARQDQQILSELKLGASRFGGVPDLPPDRPWPTFEGKKLPFVAQIDLSTLPRAPTSMLPSDGWLYAFALSDDRERTTDPVFVTVYRGPRSALVRAAPPSDAEKSLYFSAISGKSGPVGMDDLVPLTTRKQPANTEDAAEDSAGWLFGEVDPGIDSAGELADRAFKDGDDWINLLAVTSVGSMMWSDGGRLCFLIRRRDLIKQDFSRVTTAICAVL
jgi:hypothetical protein